MKPGRNDPCPCGSGIKYKRCCMSKVQLIGKDFLFIPFLKLPFSVSMAVTLAPIPQDRPKFCPLMCIGGTWDAVNFEWTTEKPNPNQIFRFGFCNRELRPIIQIQTTKGLFELVCNDVLRPEYTAFDLNLDNQRKEMLLFGNGKLVAKGEIDGQIDFNKYENVVFGLGPGFAIWCCQVRRFLLREDQVDQLEVMIPNDLSRWKEYLYGYDRITHMNEDRYVAYTYVSKYTIHKMNPKLKVARAILEAIGKNETEFENDAEITALAAQTIASLTQNLEDLIDREGTTENDLLKFFKETPAAAFLLEPDSVRQFREDEVQHYGKIDFVFEIYDQALRVTEIESHHANIFLQSAEFSKPMQHAIHQVKTWIRGAKQTPQHLEIKFTESHPTAFLGMVVIGRRSQIDTRQKRELWGEIQNDVRCLTWDDIVSRGKTFARKLNDPKISDIKWD